MQPPRDIDAQVLLLLLIHDHQEMQRPTALAVNCDLVSDRVCPSTLRVAINQFSRSQGGPTVRTELYKDVHGLWYRSRRKLILVLMGSPTKMR